MAILREHIPYYKEIFELPGFFSDPARYGLLIDIGSLEHV